MKWRKLGLVFRPDGSSVWAKSHAACPIPVARGADTIRVYISCRDASNVGRVGYVDVSADDPRQIRGVSEHPVLEAGLPGTFDDSGVMATCIVDGPDGSQYMYYVGFELGTKIRYRLLTGLAVSRDSGESFARVSKTPILERSDEELCYRCGPFVLREHGLFKMWYIAGSSWTSVAGKDVPVYDMRYAESPDGVHWPSSGKLCLALDQRDEHGFGRPWVLAGPDGYRMFYSIRKRSAQAYRLGYADSRDGVNFIRKDEELGLGVGSSGWDSQAVCFSAVLESKGRTYLFYNGNNFGETGFGVAELAA